MIQNPLAIFAVLLVAILFSVFVTERFKWAARLSTVLWVIFTSALASNVGLIPTDAPLYGDIAGLAVPFAVCVILFTVDLADVRAAGAPMLAAFGIAMVGTVAGVLIAGLVLHPFLSDIPGLEPWKIAGPYTGTFVGGSLNFFALWEGLEIGQPNLFAAANAVDNLTLFPLYLVWMTVPSLLLGRWVVAKRWTLKFDDEAEHDKDADKPRFVPLDVVTLTTLAIVVIAVSEWVKTTWVDPVAPMIPAILIVTTLALIVGQFPFVRRLQGAWQIGDLAFWAFFAAVGALINFEQAVILSPILFAYVVIVMVGHFTVVYGLGRLFRMDLGALTIASVAAKSGPALVPAVAHAKEWNHLVLPGIILGMLGYAIGNYVGFASAYLMRFLLG